jgi:hypothetical protein
VPLFRWRRASAFSMRSCCPISQSRIIKHPLDDRPEPQNRAQRTVCVSPSSRRAVASLDAGSIRRCHHHGDAQCHLARRLPAALRQHTVEPHLAQHAQRRRQVAVRQAAQQAQSLPLTGQHLVTQQPAQRFDLRRRPMRDVGQRALLDLAALAIGLSQQKRGWRCPIRDPIHVHDSRESC